MKTEVVEKPAMQLVEIKDAIKFVNAVIEFDPAPFKAQAEEYVKKYKDLIVTEEDVKPVTQIVADLNKKIKELDTARKEVKSQFNLPLNAFEAKIAQTTQVYTTTVADLKSKLEVYEKKWLAARTIVVEGLIKDAIAAAGLLPHYAANIGMISKYLNKTETNAKIKKDLAARIETQLVYQENERLAEEAKKEKLQRRLDMLKQLNLNYANQINCEITHINTMHMSDEELQQHFVNLAEQIVLANAKIEARKAQTQKVQNAESALEALLEEPVIDVQNEDIVATSVIDEQPIFPDAPINSLNVEHEKDLSPPPKTQTRFLVDLICGAEDTITPWLTEMQKYGIKVKIIKQL